MVDRTTRNNNYFYCKYCHIILNKQDKSTLKCVINFVYGNVCVRTYIEQSDGAPLIIGELDYVGKFKQYVFLIWAKIP